MARQPTVISLFTGAGGLDFGFEASGFKTVAGVEMDAACCKTLRHRKFPVIEGDIRSVSSPEILDRANFRRRTRLRPGGVDVLIGGPPCQPFSKAGYWAKGDSQRLEDPRAQTLREYIRVLDETRPKVFLLENVEGLSYSGKSEGVDTLLRAVEAVNRKRGTRYRPRYSVLSAADFGVPQMRNRFFMVGVVDGTEFEFPVPTHGSEERQLSLGLEPHTTAWDALGDLSEEDDESLAMRGKWADLLPSIPEGQNYLWHTERGVKAGGRALFGWRRHYWSFLLKLAKSRPSWTIQANPGSAIGPFHWANRRLSPRELCRLQTFPDTAEILGPLNAVQRQLGNAVPSLLGEVLARSIRKHLGLSIPRGRPKLLPPMNSPVPPPEPVPAVPAKYLHLEGKHSEHPGTGKGNRAVRWTTAADGA